jgi:hypothetical protein
MVKTSKEAGQDVQTMDAPVEGIDPLAITIETQNKLLGGLSKADRFAKGMGFKVLAIRVNPADYGANGISFTSLKPQIGWGTIHAVIGLSWATSPTGSPLTWTIKPFTMVWDALNGTLRAYKISAGAGVEIAGADIAANDMIRCILVGG